MKSNNKAKKKILITVDTMGIGGTEKLTAALANRFAKKGYDKVSNVRSGQYLRINIDAENEEKAKNMVEKMCNDLRIFNPVTQTLTILNVKNS